MVNFMCKLNRLQGARIYTLLLDVSVWVFLDEKSVDLIK